MPEADDEELATQEELERQRQKERRRRGPQELAEGYAKQKIRQELLKTAFRRFPKLAARFPGLAARLGAGAAVPAAGAGATGAAAAGAATSPVWITVIVIILIILLIILLVIGFLYFLNYLCNTGGWLGFATRGYSKVAGPNFCEILDNLVGKGGAQFGGAGAAGEFCQDPRALAQRNNTPYPRRNSPALTELLTCIRTHPAVGGGSLGSVFTYELKNEICNYTRGVAIAGCGVCAHSVNSCHYGGKTGTQGAEAADLGNEALAPAIERAARSCGAGFVLNEGDHVHISTATCDGDKKD